MVKLQKGLRMRTSVVMFCVGVHNNTLLNNLFNVLKRERIDTTTHKQLSKAQTSNTFDV